MYNIAIQHGDTGSLAEVFRDTTLLFRAVGSREFVSVETSEFIRRLVATGASKGLEQSIEGDQSARDTLARLETAVQAGAAANAHAAH